MKMTYIIIGSVLAISMIFYFTSCTNKSQSKEKNAEKQSNPKTIQTKENTYPHLREIAFSVKPTELGLSLSTSKTIVYGIIMDWEMGGAIATTVAYSTGDASLYLSSGVGVIGGGQHQNVNSASKKFVILAETYLTKASKTEDINVPNQDEVTFFFLTNKGLYSATENMQNFENNSSQWIGLFEEGNKVLNELRNVSGE